MAITTNDLNSFHQFAVSIVAQGQTDLTLAELVERWQQAQERQSANESIRQSLAEFADGQGEPAQEFIDRMKSKHKLTLDADH